MATFSQGQLDTVLDVVASTTATGQPMLDALALALAEAAEAESVSIFELCPDECTTRELAFVELADDEWVDDADAFWDAYPDSVCSWTDPGSPWFGKHPADALLAPEDAFPTWRAFRESRMNRTHGAEAGLGHYVVVPLASEPGTSRRVLVNRPAADVAFTERETTMLRLLQPHLDAAVGRALSDSSARDRLSPRELEILAYIHGGRSTKEIAAALWVSPSTVRKHLENVYVKLDVHSRTEALALVYGHSRRLGRGQT